MRRAWLSFGVAAGIWGLGNLVFANSPALQDSVWGVIENSSLIGSGITAEISGDVCAYDSNGMQCGYPTTDAAPDSTRGRAL